MRALIAALLLSLVSLTAGAPPAKKPAAVKKITTDDLLEMSIIANYTDSEDALLETLRDKPARVLAQLIKMHERRLSQLRLDEPRLHNLSRMDLLLYGEEWVACKRAIPVYEETVRKLKALQLR